MRSIVLCIAGLVLAIPAMAQTETRCGWINNPTPANWWLTDAHGEWTISVQGLGWRSEIFDIDWQGDQDWVSFNGSYGWGCGCITGEFDPATRWLESALSAEWLPLARCEADPALPPQG